VRSLRSPDARTSRGLCEALGKSEGTLLKKIKESVLTHIYSDPISEKTNKNKRNALIISGLSVLHFWNPIELTGLGFKLNNGNEASVSVILIVLLSYLSFTLILNIAGDILESNEKINGLDLKETQGNW
jgi:hypothetical protein